MRTNGVAADFIYLDASHEEEDVYEDIQNYWEVLAPGEAFCSAMIGRGMASG